MNTEIQERLAELRQAMTEAGIAATIIPQTDSHQSEYIADHWQVRRFLSGFTGSAGSLVVTADKALLWTDSRYFLQAARQLEGTSIILMKDGLPGTPSIADWLADELPEGSTVGIDMMVYSFSERDSLSTRLRRRGIKVVDFDPATVWADRPALPSCKIFVHDLKYAGRSAKDKIAEILQNAAKSADAVAVFISALDEIAWTLNIRSSDVQYNPVATAFLYLSDTGSVLFTDPAKLTDEVINYLASEGVATKDYSDVLSFLGSLPVGARVLVEPGRNASKIFDTLGARAVEGESVVALPKACKNDVQLAGVRAAMERDGVALVKAFMEIERRLSVGEQLTEMDVADILRTMRSAQPLFFDESFGTIAGYGPHGAIVHYEADETSNSIVQTGNLLLIDSGAQYLDGTTDITRTISIGEPTELQRHDFTLVMKGHIALARQIFPEGTRGAQLDALARQFLWNEGLSYLHGTGHGVGHFLNVHEGPQSIRLNNVPATLQPGMITSNEPGLYRENIHGIRCENLVLTVPAMQTEFGRFYRFETLTLFPFDLTLFDKTLMTEAEINWVNDYHTLVRSRLSPLLNSAERTWLEIKTRTL
ncbi:MAG: aminopeptidase P family protein [Muribaculaceae bacterium]|nr:aminopeptidase P family protein [Muribaculaceae bacterium]